MINKYGYKGKIIIEDLVTGEIKVFKNVVTYGFYVKASRLITGTTVNAITHIAFGSSTSVPAISDTTLGTEVYRTTVDSSSVDSSTGEIEIICDIAGGEAAFVWKEIGLFDAASVGVMTNRSSTDYDHTTGNDTRITYVISKA